jgi:hypothetical protein
VQITLVSDPGYIIGGGTAFATIHDNDIWRWAPENASQSGGGEWNPPTEYIAGYSYNPFYTAYLNIDAEAQPMEVIEPYPAPLWWEPTSSGVAGHISASFVVPSSAGDWATYNVSQDLWMSFDFDEITGEISASGTMPTDLAADNMLKGILSWDVSIDNRGDTTHEVTVEVDADVSIDVSISTIHTPITDNGDGTKSGSLVATPEVGWGSNPTLRFAPGWSFVFYLNVYERTYEELMGP